VKGLDYAPTSDPLADIDGLTRDIPEFKKLGINTIRLYSSTAGFNHTEGLSMLNTAGIYVVIDVTDAQYSIVSDKPTWNLNLFRNVTAKLSPFLMAPNLLAFIAGNEVINNVNQTLAAPFVKAAIRDVKAFIKAQGYDFPVGYAGTDGQKYTFQLQNYLNCGSDDTSVDFYGLNTYRWCGDVTYETSGYPTLTEEYHNYSRPFVFTEYGCNSVLPREFTEVAAIYGNPELTSWLSGGFVYQYHNDTNNYGLVKIDSNTAVTEFQDFSYLAEQLNNANPTGAKQSDPITVQPYLYNCPPTDPDNFLASSAALPPSPNENSCSCMYNSLQCVIDISSSTPASIAAAADFACSHGAACDDVNTNSASGVYGTWSACDDIQRASYILNSYYQNNRRQVSACNFPDASTNQNNGKVVTATTTISSCNADAAASTTTSSTVTTSTTSTYTTSTFTTSTVTTPTTSGNPATTTSVSGSENQVSAASGVSYLFSAFIFAVIMVL